MTKPTYIPFNRPVTVGNEQQYMTEHGSDQLVRLPFNNALTPEDQQRVIEAILEFEF